MANVDFKKVYKQYYQPKGIQIVDVPALTYICVDGKGDPNDENGEYQEALSLLYGLCYTIKMSKMGKLDISDYYDYVVPPLEGFWWMEGMEGYDANQKDKFCFQALIPQPDFVNEEVFAWACEEVARKKGLDVKKAKLLRIQEGLCVTSMHIGSFDSEVDTIAKMKVFVESQGYEFDYANRHHHEIYLSDFRKVEVDKMKTIIRLPIK